MATGPAAPARRKVTVAELDLMLAAGRPVEVRARERAARRHACLLGTLGAVFVAVVAYDGLLFAGRLHG